MAFGWYCLIGAIVTGLGFGFMEEKSFEKYKNVIWEIMIISIVLWPFVLGAIIGEQIRIRSKTDD